MYTLNLVTGSLSTFMYAFYGIWSKKMKMLYIDSHESLPSMWVNYGVTAFAKCCRLLLAEETH